MNPHTGDLMALEDGEKPPRGMFVLEAALAAAAAAELQGRDRVRVDLRKSGPLQDWAKKKRKAKLSAKSRRTNRA